ncbi:MAG: alkaline phosphatase family protein [Lysobacteraceae bacterium]|nr:MAG: alkaline phosphatase family protein [Xanthomonadaceae bacterium]
MKAITLSTAGIGLLLLTPCAVVHAAEPPRLVLQITVDALRGDLPERYSEHYGEGGFRYLMEKGIHFANANYQHANTETIVGHSSLATGSVPAGHGMVANVWFDRELDRLVYNIEDANYALLSKDADVDQNTEIDPTQKTAKVEGRSPNSILVSTFSDEIVAHYAGKSKAFAVSVKDRGAVSLAGHSGKAFWFSKAAGEFVTSTYYYDKYPQWVLDFNSEGRAQQYADTEWTLMDTADNYLFGDRDNQPYETDFPGFGRTFPHPYGNDKYTTTRLTLSPVGDELTLAFAQRLVDEESLGQDTIPDYLSISFSSTDYVNHMFGPSSLEAEDNLRRLDRTLAQLFSFVDDRVGLDNTSIVLSADHGSPDIPGYVNDLGNQTAFDFDLDAIQRGPIVEALQRQFGVGEALIDTWFHPYLYLNKAVIAEHGLDQAEVEAAVATQLETIPGVAQAISSTALRAGRVADTLLTQSVKHNFHPKRSGDIYVVMTPNVFVTDFDGLTVASVHGSLWRYDTFVPIYFAGYGVEENAKVMRPVQPYDIAPTLAAMLGIKAPSGAVGQALPEVLD